MTKSTGSGAGSTGPVEIMSEALSELAARVEALRGPDRELDAQISAACRLGAAGWKWADGYPDWEGRSDGRVYLEKGGPSFAASAYTASIDAAMQLVPEGQQFGVEHYPWSEHPSGHKSCGWVGNSYPQQSGRIAAATPALALTAAALKARAAA